MTNRSKMAALFGIVALISFITPLVLVEQMRRSDLPDQLGLLASSNLDSRKKQLTAFKNLLIGDIKIIANSGVIKIAVETLSSAFHRLGNDPKSIAQKLYITDNPNPLGIKQALQMADDGSSYSQIHGSYHNWFKSIIDERDYYDLFLIDPAGTIVYTVAKEDDFGTNLIVGPFANTPLATAYKKALSSAPGKISATQYKNYSASDRLPAAFISTPLHRFGEVIGVLVIQLRLDPIQNIISSDETEGEKNHQNKFSHIYITDPAGKILASHSHSSESAIVLKDGVTQPFIHKALSGGTDFFMGHGAWSENRAVSYQPFEWLSGTWALVVEMDYMEAGRISRKRLFIIMISGLLILLSAIGLGWLLAAKET